MSTAPGPTIRLDKWLWFARFFKTRSLAARLVSDGRVRVNGDRVAKPAVAVRAGDMLTFPQGSAIRVVRIVETGTRRGPAAEAQALYEDRSPEPERGEAAAPRYDRGGRPTKRDRRQMPPKSGYDA